MFSIIIPTYNEACRIAATIKSAQSVSATHETEIIVVDGGSSDDTVLIAEQCGATVVKSNRKGRATQMNAGAAMAKHEILCFVHADSALPNGFGARIALAKSKGAKSGCFRLRFDHPHWFLKANAWLTRFDVNAVRFGDQSLFARKDVFNASGGYREDLLMMEDQEIIHRLKQLGKFEVMDDYVVTSARKYIDNGIYRMQFVFYRLWTMYYLGYSQEHMLAVYRRLVRQHNL